MSQPKNILRRGETYHFRARIAGRSVNQSLKTGDRQLAIKRAKKLKHELEAGRWEVLDGVRSRQSYSTFREIFQAYREFGASRDITDKTIRDCISALSRIIRTVHGNRFNVDEAPPTILTPDLLRGYQERMLAAAKPKGPLAMDRAKASSFSTTRQGRAVFSVAAQQSRAYQALTLPDLSAFLSTRLVRGERRGWREPATPIIEQTIAGAAALKETAPARWLALVLAANIGLRRGEAVCAKWDWVREIHYKDPAGNPVKGYEMEVIKRDEFSPKGSERRISIHPEVWEAILDMRQTLDYIMPGATKNERSQAFTKNAAWLRELGWTDGKPNHALRKLFGATMATKYGLYAAQSALGHSDPRTTNDSYASFLDRNTVVKVL